MNSTTQHILQYFLDRLAELFADVETWVDRRGLLARRSKIMLNEEAYGEYAVDRLAITTEAGERIAEVVPVGASVLGAMGRVDLIGPIDQEMLLLLAKGGPSVITSITHRNQQETTTAPLYRGVDEAGWYWLESRKLSRARKLDEALFVDLLSEVSDHDLR